MKEKAVLRRELIAKRRSLPKDVWQKKSDSLCVHLQAWPQFKQARTILAYFSFRQEPDLSSLFNNKQRWGFPRCVAKSLSWHLWKPQQRLIQGIYGIQEPEPYSPVLKPAEVDLILVPGVACDRRGYRLGYGGGFYDRMFSQVEWQLKPTVGIVFDFAYVSCLPIEPWDGKLDAVCTEEKLLTAIY
ncbi:MAG: 5-formyltetrahydrofolate cyclo-ligase [Spirulinaceae cyanobacterium]